MKEKVIIIGSGLGGLSTGVILAKNGYEVTVLEQALQPGGCLQCFYRGGTKFETGMHFIGSASPGQTLDRLMHYLEMDEVKLSSLDKDGYDVISLDGERFRFASGRENFINELVGRFPDQRKNLERYFDIVEKVANASSLHSMKTVESDIAICTEYQLRSIDNVLDEVISDPLLRKVLVGNLPLYAAEYGKTPFSTHAFITDFYNRSAYRVVGGSDSITSSLVATIERYGGRVLTNKRVTHIDCDETHATGVTTAGGEQFVADYIFSTIHPKRTIELLDTKLIRPIFKKRIMAVPETTGGFSVYLKFKEGKMPYMNYNFYGYRYSSPWNCENYDDATWPKGYLYMHLCHEDGARYAKSGVILSYMTMRELEQWKDTTVGRRGKEYLQFKERKAKALIDVVAEEFPELKDSIEAVYTATPLTYRDYTGTEDGSMYGIAKDVGKMNECRIPQRTRVPNLFLAGQNINSHGMLGVLVGSIVACSELLTAETIYQQIIDTPE